MSLAFFDTESCGFHGPTVLIQYAYDDGPITLHEVWCEPIWTTLQLIEQFCEEEAIIGFNLAFDWFHMARLYTVLVELAKHVGMDAEPRDHVDLFAELEPIARDGVCVKPKSALDLMLYARKGPYQSTMDRKDIRIKRVPRLLAPFLVQELERRVPLKDIYFAKKKDKKQRWQIYPTKIPKTNKYDPDFVDVVLKFAPSAALKVLAQDALGKDKVLTMADVACENKPLEVGWAPFALALSNKEKGWKCKVGKKEGYAWPAVIEDHIYHWRYHHEARKYATDDVIYTRGVYNHFGAPPHGDDDSILACLVGVSRWRGFAVDLAKIDDLIAQEELKIAKAPRAPHHVYIYLTQVMTPTERAAFDEDGSTKKTVLETLSKMVQTCPHCGGIKCPKCDQRGTIKHPVAVRAEECLDSRKSYTKNVLFKKLKQAGRLHPSASVIGSLSGRMSGRTEVGDGKKSSSLNALGIQHEKTIRSAFPLAFGDLKLCGGDFSSFEISIADAAYNDETLRTELLTCYVCKRPRTIDQYEDLYCPHCEAATRGCACKRTVVVFKGKESESKCDCGNYRPKGELENSLRKLHGLFAMELFNLSYEEVIATKGTAEDRYDYGKRGVFSQLYGGNEDTLVNRLGIDKETAIRASANFARKYQGVGRNRQKIKDMFCSMQQPNGIGTQVVWNEPAEKIESLTGFPRYFTLENMICKALYKLAENPPKQWGQLRVKVVRRDREQTAGGAIKSAIFAAAFQVQAHNMRAAANHEIQSTGAILCKNLQVRLWSYQPAGVHKWRVQPFNIHDELMCPALPSLIPELTRTVREFVKETKPLVPLVSMDWSPELNTWADK